MKRGRRLAVSMLVLLGLSLTVGNSSARAETINIWYPALHQPYRALVDDVIGGIEAGIGNTSSVEAVEIADPTQWVLPNDKGIVLTAPLIARVTPQRAESAKVVAGLAFDLGDIPGISLSIAPEVWLQTIRSISTEIEQVFFVGEFPQLSGDSFATERPMLHAIDTNILGHIESEPLLSDSAGRVAIVFAPTELAKYPREYIAALTSAAWREQWVTLSSRTDLIEDGFTLALVPDYHEYGQALAQAYERDALRDELALPEIATRLVVSIRSARRVGLDTRRSALGAYDEVRR